MKDAKTSIHALDTYWKPAFVTSPFSTIGNCHALDYSSSQNLCTVFKVRGVSQSRGVCRGRDGVSVSMRTPKQGAGRSSDLNSGKETGDQGDVGKPAPSPPQIDSVSVQRRLLKILNSLINLESQRGKVEELILQLESLKSRPETPMFAEMVLSGEWTLVFSSTRTKADGNIRIREIGQIFNTEKKSLTNQVLFSFPSADGADEINANLLVSCSYTFAGAGRLEVTLGDHQITIIARKDGKKVKMPEDMKAVIQNLQRALPIEFFDPSGLLDISYVQPNCRIARFVGKRLAGVRNVFVRVGTKG